MDNQLGFSRGGYRGGARGGKTIFYGSRGGSGSFGDKRYYKSGATALKAALPAAVLSSAAGTRAAISCPSSSSLHSSNLCFLLILYSL
jgi:hypothetical protein